MIEGIRKPEPEIYRRAVQRLGVDPGSCAYLDDLGVNLKPARAMGMHTIKVGDPHVALTELAAHGDDRDLTMLLAAGGFRDLTRVASGSPRMSRDMVVGNRDALRGALRIFREQLNELERLLDDPEAMLDRAEAAKRTRDAFPIVRRSLLPARFEVVIAVPDRPGEFARITKALGDADVNIKDLEVLSVREAGGALRLAFDDEDGLKRGTQALEAAGYEARGRG